MILEAIVLSANALGLLCGPGARNRAQQGQPPYRNFLPKWHSMRLAVISGRAYHWGMTHPVREARLRPEFAGSYPNVPAGNWLPAADMGAALLLAHLASPTPVPLGQRLMDDAHFEFRGGAPREYAAGARTRQTDA